MVVVVDVVGVVEEVEPCEVELDVVVEVVVVVVVVVVTGTKHSATHRLA